MIHPWKSQSKRKGAIGKNPKKTNEKGEVIILPIRKTRPPSKAIFGIALAILQDQKGAGCTGEKKQSLSMNTQTKRKQDSTGKISFRKHYYREHATQ